MSGFDYCNPILRHCLLSTIVSMRNCYNWPKCLHLNWYSHSEPSTLCICALYQQDKERFSGLNTVPKDYLAQHRCTPFPGVSHTGMNSLLNSQLAMVCGTPSNFRTTTPGSFQTMLIYSRGSRIGVSICTSYSHQLSTAQFELLLLIFTMCSSSWMLNFIDHVVGPVWRNWYRTNSIKTLWEKTGGHVHGAPSTSKKR